MTQARISRTGSFSLPVSVEEAFPLFTAEGESRWVPGWAPDILGDLPQQPGLVFLTESGGDRTIWTVLVSDEAAGRLLYSRVTPGRHAGTVEVRLEPDGAGTRVAVTYAMTALPPAGAEALDPYSEANFRDMLEDWRALIARVI